MFFVKYPKLILANFFWNTFGLGLFCHELFCPFELRAWSALKMTSAFDEHDGSPWVVSATAFAEILKLPHCEPLFCEILTELCAHPLLLSFVVFKLSIDVRQP